MSSARTTAIALAVIFGAGCVGFLVYRLSANDGHASFEDRINAAASAATEPSRASSSPARSADDSGPRSATEVLKGTDDPESATESPAAAPSQAAVPKSVPAVTLPDLTGNKRNLSEWHGRPLLINFWATWCGPCREEIPMLIRLRAEHAKQGLEIIGIALDFHDAVAGYATRAGMTYPVLVAEEDMTTVQAFGMGASAGLPTTIVADRTGKIVARHVGALDKEEAEKLLKPVL